MAMVISKIPSEFPSEWKKYICKRQPIIKIVFYFANENGERLGNDGCGITDSTIVFEGRPGHLLCDQELLFQS